MTFKIKKRQAITYCNMAGGVLLGLTSQTNVATTCGSDWISFRPRSFGAARSLASDR